MEGGGYNVLDSMRCGGSEEMLWLIGSPPNFWGRGPGFRLQDHCDKVENLRVQRGKPNTETKKDLKNVLDPIHESIFPLPNGQNMCGVQIPPSLPTFDQREFELPLQLLAINAKAQKQSPLPTLGNYCCASVHI